jgi:hypothetical protein
VLAADPLDRVVGRLAGERCRSGSRGRLVADLDLPAPIGLPRADRNPRLSGSAHNPDRF